MFRTICFSVLLPLLCFSCADEVPRQPNVVIIYADDMGYGDLSLGQPDAKIPTPNLDKLASEGMRFTDAHSSSGICSPSRYALLTGTYHWRRQHDIVHSFGPPFFADADLTLPQMLQDNGYTTACIGKWHLGWDWQFSGGPSAEVMQWGKMRQYYLPSDLDLSGPVGGGPLARGFDYYFGDGTINFPPYAWMETDHFIEAPTTTMFPDSVGYAIHEGEWEFRPGPKVPGWNPYEVLPTLTDKAVSYLHEQTEEQPFFLYFPLPSPHAPIIPNEAFQGTSAAGEYGDFMVETDHMIGRVLTALEEAGHADNTLVIFSSDNGPEKYAFARAERFGHFSMGNLRGLKRDVWEGGHRVPMMVRWPGKVPAGIVVDETITQTDLMPTIAALTGVDLPEGAAPDGYDQTALVLGEAHETPARMVTVHNTYSGLWGLREGDWLYLNKPSGKHSKMPESFRIFRNYETFTTKVSLFNLRDDPGQLVNLSEQFPERITRMEKLLAEARKE